MKFTGMLKGTFIGKDGKAYGNVHFKIDPMTDSEQLVIIPVEVTTILGQSYVITVEKTKVSVQ